MGEASPMKISDPLRPPAGGFKSEVILPCLSRGWENPSFARELARVVYSVAILGELAGKALMSIVLFVVLPLLAGGRCVPSMGTDVARRSSPP